MTVKGLEDAIRAAFNPSEDDMTVDGKVDMSQAQALLIERLTQAISEYVDAKIENHNH